MLLQVHDELVFEVPEDEVAKTLPVVKAVMEEAPMPALPCRCRSRSTRPRGSTRIRTRLFVNARMEHPGPRAETRSLKHRATKHVRR